MKKIISVFLMVTAIAGAYALTRIEKPKVPQTKNAKTVKTPLLKYSFESLKKTVFPGGAIELGRETQDGETVRTQLFYFYVPSVPGGKDMLKVSGLMNTPSKPGTYPIIVMFRGFVPDDIYEPGVGTQRVAESLTKNGYITIAPDFLGFGESDKPSSDSFEARFQTYTTALNLFASLDVLNNALVASYSGEIKADISRVGIWGHSNGGHIALSVLAQSGLSYPTVLWAPVSKSFPYSILYYTDEADDQGQALRKVLADFEEIYDVHLFSPELYYSWINAPLLLQQGGSDREVPVYWSDDLTNALEKEKIQVKYVVYPNADHNLVPSWNEATNACIDFFDAHLK